MKKEYYAAKKSGHYFTFGGSGDISSTELSKQSLYARRIYAESAAKFIGGNVVPVHLVEVSELDAKQVAALFKLMNEFNSSNDLFDVVLKYLATAKNGSSRELAVVQAFINDRPLV